MYVPNICKMVAVQNVFIKESKVGSIPDNTEMPDLLVEGLSQLEIRHPDYGHQDDDNKKEQGAYTTKKEEWHDAESVNTQETTRDEMPRKLRKQH